MGALGAYVLDAMRYKEGAFLASRLAMAAANLATPNIDLVTDIIARAGGGGEGGRHEGVDGGA